MAGKTIVPKRSTSDIVEDWAKYAYQDMSDDILAKAFKDGRLLESLEYRINSKTDTIIDVEFSYLLYGAFVDMGVGRNGFGSFKAKKWYARNMQYSATKLGSMMLSRFGGQISLQIQEAFPNIIKM